MDDHDLNRKFAEILAQLTALQLIANEALSLALYHEQEPDKAVYLCEKEHRSHYRRNKEKGHSRAKCGIPKIANREDSVVGEASTGRD